MRVLLLCLLCEYMSSCVASLSGKGDGPASVVITVLAEANYQSEIMAISAKYGGMQLLSVTENEFTMHLQQISLVCAGCSASAISVFETEIKHQPFVRSIKIMKQ